MSSGSLLTCVECAFELPAGSVRCPRCGRSIATEANSGLDDLPSVEPAARAPVDPRSPSPLREPARGSGLPDGLTQRFDVVRTLGTGGMGVVYLARDRRLGREVAIKLISGSSPDMARRFEREGRLLAGIEHDHVVRLYDCGLSQGVSFLVMEYVRGKSLSARLAEGRPTMVEAATIALDILKGVQQAHAQEIIHRDLKPANVFLEGSGRAKVADFGLARRTDDGDLSKDERTALGAVMGTPGYMAPEQARGERVAPAADIYAVGVILHQMLTGQKLFTGSFPAVLAAQLQGTITPPSNVNHNVPSALDELVCRSLALAPDERPTAEAFAVSLQSWLDGVTRTRRATSPDPLPPHPYKLLEHFRPEDSAIFFGREAEIHEVVELVENPRCRIIFLFGPCGIGKSSLLHAGVLPALDRSRFDPVVMVSGPDAAWTVRQAVAGRAALQKLALPTGEPITPSLVEQNPRLVLDLLFLLQGPTTRMPVLVLDQLEEVFTQNPRGSPRAADLVELISLLVEAQALRIKVVLSFRTEFRGDLFPLEERLRRFERSFRVKEIAESGLLGAIEGPSTIEGYGFSYEKEFPRWLADDIYTTTRERGESALPVMQIICRQLFDRMRAKGASEIGRELYDSALGGAAGALRRYVEERLASPEYLHAGAMARQMLKALTMKEQGGERFARALDEQEVLAFPDTERARQTLERLVTDHLLLREAGDRGGRRVRLASEIICQLVDAWTLEPDEAERAGRALSHAYRQWEEDGRASKDLLPTGTLALIQRQQSALKDISEGETRLVEASIRHHHRRRLTLLALVSVPLAGMFAGILGLVSYSVSRQVMDTESRQLESTRLIVREFMERHYERLVGESTVIAESPKLIAAIDTGDPGTVAGEAERYQAIVHAGLFMVTDAKFRILASLARTGACIAEARDVPGLTRAARGAPATGVLARGGTIYLVVTTPVEIQGVLTGYLTTGFEVNQKFADLIKTVAASDVVITLDDSVLVSTVRLGAGTRPGKSVLTQADEARPKVRDPVVIDDSEYLPLTFPLSPDRSGGAARFTLLRRLDAARGFVLRIRTILGTLSTGAMLMTLLIYGYLLKKWYQ